VKNRRRPKEITKRRIRSSDEGKPRFKIRFIGRLKVGCNLGYRFGGNCSEHGSSSRVPWISNGQ
jgi:hypothetical protein